MQSSRPPQVNAAKTLDSYCMLHSVLSDGLMKQSFSSFAAAMREGVALVVSKDEKVG